MASSWGVAKRYELEFRQLTHGLACSYPQQYHSGPLIFFLVNARTKHDSPVTLTPLRPASLR